jgi:hypothetical protein
LPVNVPLWHRKKYANSSLLHLTVVADLRVILLSGCSEATESLSCLREPSITFLVSMSIESNVPADVYVDRAATFLLKK